MTNWTDFTVADLMTIDPVTVRVDATVEEAERLMRLYRVHGLPVVDEYDNLVGVISQTDLLSRNGLPVAAMLHNKPSGLRVGELMTSPALTVPIATSLAEAARMMRDGHVHRLVAVDDDRAIGVLSAIDYVNLVADAYATA